jgi:hypothetical protein
MQRVITNIGFTRNTKLTVTNAHSFLLFGRVVVSILDLSSVFIAALSSPAILKSSLLLSPKQQQEQEVTVHK